MNRTTRSGFISADAEDFNLTGCFVIQSSLQVFGLYLMSCMGAVKNPVLISGTERLECGGCASFKLSASL